MKLTQFNAYAKFYDTVYQNKDYQKEAEFVEKALITSLGKKPKKILSLGCGTASYEIELAKKGYEVVGIDMSEEMLRIGRVKIQAAGAEDKVKLMLGDVRELGEIGEFEAVVMLFNIVGYMNTNEELERMLRSVNQQLVPGGVFLFDGWLEAAVLQDPPTDRVKEIRNKNGERIIRLTKSNLDVKKNLVKIDFQALRLMGDKILDEAKEEHPMRFFSVPELAYFLNQAGLDLVRACNFLDWETEVDGQKWDMLVVGQKKAKR